MSVVLVCGSRHWADERLLNAVLEGVIREGLDTVRHGAAHGADAMAEAYCRPLGIPTDPMPADWERFGKSAGSIRNAAMMAKQPQPRLVVAFMAEKTWSPGTANMIRQAEGTCPVLLVQWR